MENHSDRSPYRGLRALLLTRVSTAEQEKKYSHAAQERQVREKLIEPLGLRLDEEHHIIHDTYTGLEYRYRKALDTILTLAEQGEFDVLCMDVLDRGLGRKALAREIFRMQLRELGVRILTTEPSDHADDDSLEGQIIRFRKGINAEEEINDLVRRTKNGKREKALGNEEKGIPQQIVGAGNRLYGYEFVCNERGIRIGYKLKLDVIHVEADGTKWTEVKVVTFIFESAASGISVRTICTMLNAKQIPTSYGTKGMHHKLMKKVSVWQPAVVSYMLKNTAYYGEFRQFRKANVGRTAGRKSSLKRNTDDEEQVIISIPAIVTKELALEASKRVAQNKQLATLNNQTSKECLMRGGLGRCAYCGTTIRVYRGMYTLVSGEEKFRFSYNCCKPYTREGRCSGCSIMVDELDSAVIEKIYETIRDPSEVDAKIQHLTKDNPVIEHRKKTLKSLTEFRKEKERLQANLSEAMRKKILDERSIGFLNGQLALLEEQEQKARKELDDEQALQDKYNALQREIAAFHQQCREWREQIDDPAFTPSFTFLHDACLYFGIHATVFKTGSEPRYLIHTDPPDIVKLLSRKTCH
jgi:site-specific DNA recombinase